MLAIRRIDNRLISVSIALVLLFSLLAAAFISPTSADGPGYALDFDGLNDYVSLGDTGDLMGGTGWMSTKTISVWLNPTTAAPPVSYPGTGEVIVSTDFPRLFGITRSVYNGLDRIWVWNADSNAVYMIGVAFTPGEWVNITMVHSGGMLTVYKNGVPWLS